jgi:hypothetical protein
MVPAGRSSLRRRPRRGVGWPTEAGSERPSGGLIDQDFSTPCRRSTSATMTAPTGRSLIATAACQLSPCLSCARHPGGCAPRARRVLRSAGSSPRSTISVGWSSKRAARKPRHGASRSGRGVRCSGPAMLQSTQSDGVNRHRSTRILALFFLLQSRNGRDRLRASRCCVSRCRGFAG